MNKSLYDISWKVSEEEYREDPSYSYSKIARFDREGFDCLDKLDSKVESPSLLFGSMVDTLITEGEEAFYKKYDTCNIPIMSDTLKSIAEQLFNCWKDEYESLNDIPDGIIANVGEDFGYYTDSKYKSTRVKKIREACTDYYDILRTTEGRIVVNNEDYMDALDCSLELHSNPYTNNYFKDDNPFEPHIKRYYQLKFKGEYEGIPVRCMADLLLVNYETKEIIPIDLKTSSKKEWQFHKSFVEWRYYIQAQLYWYIIRQTLDNDDYFKDFKLLDYQFIVINRKTKKPMVWEYTHTRSDVDLTYKDVICRNWRNILKELDYYIKNNPNYPIGVTEKNDLVSYLNK